MLNRSSLNIIYPLDFNYVSQVLAPKILYIMHIPENALKSKIPPTIDWTTEKGLASKIRGAGIRNTETINLTTLSALF